ncbi:MAG: glycosyltransferase [Betaproteobacteria bacterium]|nr:glycosyltransferase [Betaproteobacteria bacterium]
MNDALVSVIMNGRNVADYVASAIESVLSQTYRNWEIVFWDNQSEDGTADIVHSFGEPRIRYFLAETFTPLGQARNLAIEQSKGAFIAFLDCDDLWFPDKLASQIPFFDDAKVGLVFSDTIFFNELGHERVVYNGALPCEGECFRTLLGRYFLSMETVVVRREAIEKQSPWFDPRFNMIEEADLFRRISHDWKVAGVPRPLAKWRVHASSWTFKYPHLLRQETKMMLNDYRERYANFDREFGDEIAQLLDSIDLEEAKNAWIRGRKGPLVRHFAKGGVSGLIKAGLVACWPTSLATLALRLRGEVLPATLGKHG